MKIPFGINFKLSGGKHSEYKYAEWSNWIECASSVSPDSLRDDYIQFLRDWGDGKIKKSTLVDLECLKLFQGDLDNRAQIDYREAHDHEDYIIAGGQHYDQWARKLEAHIENSLQGTRWLAAYGPEV